MHVCCICRMQRAHAQEISSLMQLPIQATVDSCGHKKLHSIVSFVPLPEPGKNHTCTSAAMQPQPTSPLASSCNHHRTTISIVAQCKKQRPH